jgi:hypothetical protein
MVSHDLRHQFDMLIADVPALSVGLLGFAVLTFFMILKKLKLSVFQEIHGDMRTHFHSERPFSFILLFSSLFSRQ